MVKLFCAIVGAAGSAFEVDIAEDASVSALKKAIKAENERTITCDAKDLQLFRAKTDKGKGAWLTEADVKNSVSDTTVLTPLDVAGAPLNLVDLSEEDVQFRLTKNDVIAKKTPVHVLVVVPKEENDHSPAMDLGVVPPLLPSTIHRHPERLKRWAAINAMIRQKNQVANQKTTSEDTKKPSKKRKNHDVDKTAGYSSLCWEDIKPIYNFDDSYDLQPEGIPDADIELLLARIVDLRELYGQISDGKEAKRLFFVAPILETVSRLLKNVRILVEEDVVGKNVLLKGRFEFVLKRGTKRIALVEAKREDMLQGLVQNVTGLEVLADAEDLSVVYGIVTNFLEWKFLISEDDRVRQQECTLPLTDTIPTFEGLKEIVGKIYAMLQ